MGILQTNFNRFKKHFFIIFFYPVSYDLAFSFDTANSGHMIFLYSMQVVGFVHSFPATVIFFISLFCIVLKMFTSFLSFHFKWINFPLY